MMFSSLCAALLLVGGCSASWVYRYEEIFKAVDPVSTPLFHSNALSYQEVWYDTYSSYHVDIGLYVIPAGKSGNFSFGLSYPQLPEGHYVVYIGSAKLLDESKRAVHHDFGEWEEHNIIDVYMRIGDYAVAEYTPDGAEYTPPSADVARDVTFWIRRQKD